ncbi:MAG: site-specific DNA-methyltransferase [Bacteroidaceae bacterium]|nr:site-specific DNA-methyltransferase [Bacteroidaceae bacterium]
MNKNETNTKKELSLLKQDMLAEIRQRLEDRVLERSNAELLEKLIMQADSDDEAIKIMSLGTTYKKSGMHYEKRLEKMDNTIRYFKKNESLSFHTDDSKPVNKLIIGDNYEALQNLLIQYKKGIGVIYIDPPYGKDSMGEFAKTNYENGITRDNLLSMLYPRLMLAKQLLTDEGVIFCSIDDKNYAYLKCLFDEVFGESSYVSTLTIETSVIAGRRRVPAMQGSIVKTAEYCLIYSKSKDSQIMKNLKYDFIYGFDTHYNKWVDEENGKIISLNDLIKNNKAISDIFKSYKLPISIQNLGTLTFINEEIRRWLYSNEIASCLYRKGDSETPNSETDKQPLNHLFNIDSKWYLKTEEGLYNVFRYIDRIGKCDDYFNSYGERTVRGNLWKGFSSDGGNLEKEGGVSFKNGKKPLRLIKQLIDSVSVSNDSVILDFFAGSGTTGHAVLDLNKDGGNRTFILCQINEKTPESPNGIAYDVTSKRLKRVMTGQCYDGSRNRSWLSGDEPYGGNLDVYEMERVPNHLTAGGQTPFEAIDETLYGKEKFKTLKEKIDWVCQNFANTQRYAESDEDWEEVVRKGGRNVTGS